MEGGEQVTHTDHLHQSGSISNEEFAQLYLKEKQARMELEYRLRRLQLRLQMKEEDVKVLERILDMRRNRAIHASLHVSSSDHCVCMATTSASVSAASPQQTPVTRPNYAWLTSLSQQATPRSDYGIESVVKKYVDNGLLADLENESVETRLSALDRLIQTATLQSIDADAQSLLSNDLSLLFDRLRIRLLDSNLEVLLGSVHLLQVLCQQSSVSIELFETAFRPMLPMLVSALGDSRASMRTQTLQLLSTYAKSSSTALNDVIAAAVKYGLEADDWRVRKATADALANTLLTRDMGGASMDVLVGALVARLRDISDVVCTCAATALKQLRLLMGDVQMTLHVSRLSPVLQQLYRQHQLRTNAQEPNEIISPNTSPVRRPPTAKGPETPTFKTPVNLMSNNFTDVTDTLSKVSISAHPTSSEPIEYGFIPAQLITQLRDNQDWKTRVTAIERLLKQVHQTDDPASVIPHLSDIFNVLTPLLEDPNFKISLTTLYIVGELVVKVGLSIKPHLNSLVPALLQRFANSKIVVRQAIVKILTHLMSLLTPKPLLVFAMHHLTHENVRIREEIINVIIAALLLFPQYAFDWPTLVLDLLTPLRDAKAKIKFVAVETYAVISSRIGPDRLLQMLRGYDVDADTLSILAQRLENPLLPFVNQDGLVEHVGIRSASCMGSRPASSSSVIMHDFEYGSHSADPGMMNVAPVSLQQRPSLDLLPKMGGAVANSTSRRPVMPTVTEESNAAKLPWERDTLSSSARSVRPVRSVLPLGDTLIRPPSASRRPRGTAAESSLNTALTVEPEQYVPTFPKRKSATSIEATTTEPPKRSFDETPIPTLLERNKEAVLKKSTTTLPRSVSHESNESSNASDMKSSSSSLLDQNENNHTEQTKRVRPKPQHQQSQKQSSTSTAPGTNPVIIAQPTSISPQDEFRQALMWLRSEQEWNVKVQALETLRRLGAEESSLLLSQLHEVTLCFLNEIGNLRSQVSRAALTALVDIHAQLGKAMDPELEFILTALLKKAGEGNQFINELIDRAMDQMCSLASPVKLLNALMHLSEQRNPLLRSKVARTMWRCFSLMNEVQKQKYVQLHDVERLVQILCVLVTDGLAETRTASRRLLSELSLVMSRTELEKLFDRVLTSARAKELREILASSAKMMTNQSVQLNLKTSPRKLPANGTLKRKSSNSSGSLQKTEKEEYFQTLYADMASNDWKKRFEGIQRLVQQVEQHPEDFQDHAQLVACFDIFNERLHDANSKVNLLALQMLVELVPRISVDLVLPGLISILANNLASLNPSIKQATITAMDTLLRYADKQVLMQTYVNVVQYGTNARVRPVVLEKLIDVVTHLLPSKSSLVQKSVVPLALRLLGDARGEMRPLHTKLCQILHEAFGAGFLDQALQLGQEHYDKLEAIL